MELRFDFAGESDRAARSNRVQRVSNQVEKDSLQRRFVRGDFGQTRIKNLLDLYATRRGGPQPGHPERPMKNLMDVDRLALEALGVPAYSQHSLDQSRDSI